MVLKISRAPINPEGAAAVAARHEIDPMVAYSQDADGRPLPYAADPYAYKRRNTRVVMVGDVAVGGDNPIRIQSMTTTLTSDTLATVEQTERMVAAGCEIVRITTPTVADARNLKEIKAELLRRGVRVPLVADIHFSPAAALEAANWAEKVRVNPGNYADPKKFAVKEYTDALYAEEIERMAVKFRPLVARCKANGVSMRIGTNHGSLSDRIMNRYGDTPEGMVESALEFVRVAEAESYYDIIFSMKASNPKVMVEAYRLLAARLAADGHPAYPLHLGVTEAGNGEDGRIKSAAGIGALLEDGLGDTIRVSLTEEPEFEIPVAFALAERYTPRNRRPDTSYTPDAPLYDIQPATLPDSRDPFHFAPRQTISQGVGTVRIGGEQPTKVAISLPALNKAGSFEAAADALVTGIAPIKKSNSPLVQVARKNLAPSSDQNLTTADPSSLTPPSFLGKGVGGLGSEGKRPQGGPVSSDVGVARIAPSLPPDIVSVDLRAGYTTDDIVRLRQRLDATTAAQPIIAIMSPDMELAVRALDSGAAALEVVVGQDHESFSTIVEITRLVHARNAGLWLTIEADAQDPAFGVVDRMLDIVAAIAPVVGAAAAWDDVDSDAVMRGEVAPPGWMPVLGLRLPDESYSIRAYRLLNSRLDATNAQYPLVLHAMLDGRAGRESPATDDVIALDDQVLEAAIALGGLLADGIGHAVLIETAPGAATLPETVLEVGRLAALSFNVLQAAGARVSKADFIACPSCGRTLFDLQSTTERIKAQLGHLVGVKIAVMGCIVNGLGELADADFGYMGGAPGKVNLFVGKTEVEKGVPTDQAVDRLIALIKEHGKWQEPE